MLHTNENIIPNRNKYKQSEFQFNWSKKKGITFNRI